MRNECTLFAILVEWDSRKALISFTVILTKEMCSEIDLFSKTDYIRFRYRKSAVELRVSCFPCDGDTNGAKILLREKR